MTSELESTSPRPESGSDATNIDSAVPPEGDAKRPDEPAADAAPAVASPPTSPVPSVSKWRRFFLLEDELKSAEALAFLPGQPGFAEFVLARSALEAAQTLLDVPEHRDAGLLLIRDALRLSIAARSSRLDLPAGASHEEALSTLEARAPELFATEHVPPADLELVRQAYCRGDDVTLAALAPADRERWIRALVLFVPRIIDASQREAELAALVRGRRTLRVGGVVALVILLLGTAAAVLTLATRRSNVALHKRIALSSIYDAKRFPATGLVDGDTAKIGCHTKSEPNPWARIDLEQPTEIQEVVVYNRAEFADRATPLIIEVSADGRSYRPFARRNDVFAVWHAKATPVVARYVRLTIAKTSALHFNEVQVF